MNQVSWGAEKTTETTRQPTEFRLSGPNPDDVTPAKAAFWHQLGINRISVGALTHAASWLDLAMDVIENE